MSSNAHEPEATSPSTVITGWLVVSFVVALWGMLGFFNGIGRHCKGLKDVPVLISHHKAAGERNWGKVAWVDVDEWLRAYNEERPHSGKYCYGKTPWQTFLDSKHLALEKDLNRGGDRSDTTTRPIIPVG